MVFATTGSLPIERDDLETRAKNLLEKTIYFQTEKLALFCAKGNFDEEIKFLIKNEYILQKEKSPNAKYEITSKGRGYILGQFPRF